MTIHVIKDGKGQLHNVHVADNAPVEDAIASLSKAWPELDSSRFVPVEVKE